MGLLNYVGAGLADGFGKGMVMAGTIGIEDRRDAAKAKRDENLARFKQDLDKDTATFAATLKEEHDIKAKGREDYALGQVGDVISREKYEALTPEERAAYRTIPGIKNAREDAKDERDAIRAAASERQATAAERRADAAEKTAGAAVTRADKYVPGGGEKPITPAQKNTELHRLRIEASGILERAGMGEDVSADVTWYNSQAAEYGLPEIKKTTVTVPGKKGLIWDDPEKQVTSWGFAGAGEHPSFAQPEKAAAPAQPEKVTAPSFAKEAKPTPTKEVKPPAGAPADARQAKDGNWYAPDPSRPGKYLMYSTEKEAASPAKATPKEQPAKVVPVGDQSNMTQEQKSAAARARGGADPLPVPNKNLSGLNGLNANNERVSGEATATKEKVRAGIAKKEQSAEQKEVARLKELSPMLKEKAARGGLSTGKDQADYEKASKLWPEYFKTIPRR